jgi:hypothetical protein
MSTEVSSCPVAVRKKATGRGGWRPGAGRKPAFEDSVDRTLRFERRDLETLEAMATERGVTTADLVREAVRGYLGKRTKR